MSKDRMQLQSEEFEAMAELAKRWASLQVTAIVDDDYPEVRYAYDSALRRFLSACKANGWVTS